MPVTPPAPATNTQDLLSHTFILFSSLLEPTTVTTEEPCGKNQTPFFSSGLKFGQVNKLKYRKLMSYPLRLFYKLPSNPARVGLKWLPFGSLHLPSQLSAGALHEAVDARAAGELCPPSAEPAALYPLCCSPPAAAANHH